MDEWMNAAKGLLSRKDACIGTKKNKKIDKTEQQRASQQLYV